MNINPKIVTFIVASFALAEVCKTATVMYMPNIKPSATFVDSKQKEYFSDFSIAITGKSESVISGLVLSAVFISNDDTSFVLLNDNGKQILLDKNKEYNGYKLTDIFPDKAILIKDSSKYTLILEKPNASNTQTISKQSANQIFSNANDLLDAIDVTQTDSGVKILKIKSGSVFDKMGLNKDDVILAVNDTKISNVATLTSILPNMQNEHEIKIKILRNNQEKEFNYAIK